MTAKDQKTIMAAIKILERSLIATERELERIYIELGRKCAEQRAQARLAAGKR